MQKRRLFLLVFLFSFALVVSGGLLAGKIFPQKNASEVQHFPRVPTSISTSELGPANPNVTPPPKSDKRKQVWYKNQVVVLTYHHVTDQTDQRYVIAPDQFAEHMAFLYENDLHPISLSEFLRFVSAGVLPTENAVLITFDDGYESYYTKAFPVLQQFHFPSVNFLITGRLRDTVERKRENMTTPLSVQQVKEMLASGLVEFGSHTYSLHEQATKNEWGELGPQTAPVYLEDLERLEDDQGYRDRLYVDFTMSRVGISDLIGRPIDTISLPFGYGNEIVLQMAQQAGYHYVFNSKPGVVRADVNPLAIPRFDVGLREIDVSKLHQLFTKAKNEFEGEQS
ncbi:polysaccharide deacetylase family protein [Brevibacillus sp. H7]|uniref:polysaccharide deacetylase family protein n=1 Tax=Brevibacillus sp. H7 TaxID=3349138 RepID=UPI0038197EA8